MKLSLFARLLIYTLLITGSAVYLLPYLWMATSSLKVEREYMSADLRLLPERPLPQTRSPYIDARYYADVTGPHLAALLPEFAKLVRESKFQIPDHLDRAATEAALARGLYDKLRKVLPDEVWAQGVPAIVAKARQRVDAATVQEVYDTVYRSLRIGPLRVRSVDLKEQELAANRPVSQRLENQTPAVLRLIDLPPQKGGVPYATVHYDFGQGERGRLARTFDLDFPAQDIFHIQLDLTPDDTWHEIWVTVEKEGKRYTPRRPTVLANFQPLTVFWREPSDDDHSTKLKNWVVVDAVRGEASPITDPRQLRLTLEFRPVGSAKAVWNKMARNYQRVEDEMPFARYLRVSLFLVIANIVLTMFASSLVAYAFARLNWPGREFLFVVLLATMMIPGQVTMIPHFLIWKHLGAYNTLTPLWAGAAFGNAFFIFMMRQFLKGIPRDLEDAARIDGCGFLRIYWHIMLPLVKPSLAAIAIFTFMGTWNNFMGPLIYVADQRLYPLALGLYAYFVQLGGNPPLIMAASLVMTVPVIAIFFFAQKYFIQGVTLTGIKG